MRALAKETCGSSHRSGITGAVWRFRDLMRYEILIEGPLDERWSAWFEGLEVTAGPGDVTVIGGQIPDQAALHGLLARVRDLGLTLITVRRVEPRGRRDASR
jgi:hypothetical protein